MAEKQDLGASFGPGHEASPSAASGVFAESHPSRGDVKLSGRVPIAKNALLLPNLAVHCSVNRRGAWTITHRPTGCAIGHAETEEAAVTAAHELEAAHPKAFARLAELEFGQGFYQKRRPAPITRLVRDLERRGLR